MRLRAMVVGARVITLLAAGCGGSSSPQLTPEESSAVDNAATGITSYCATVAQNALGGQQQPVGAEQTQELDGVNKLISITQIKPDASYQTYVGNKQATLTMRQELSSMASDLDNGCDADGARRVRDAISTLPPPK